MKYFNVPADFKKETIDKYYELNNTYKDSKVYETYGQITIGNLIGSGRAYDLIPKVDMAQLKSYIEYSQDRGISFNYTLNATCLGNREFTREGIGDITAFLEELYHCGVRSLTISLPSLIELVRRMGYNFEIKASTVCQIINPNKAMAYKKLGADKIVLDESINRDFDTLRRIRQAFGSNVEVIVNVICHKNCIYEMFHHNQTSHDIGNESKAPSVTYYSHRCMMKRCENVSNILKLGWIRPDDIKYYTDIGIQYFKLQGRQAVLNGDPLRATECYFQEYYDGNLMHLLDMFSPTNSFIVYVDNRKLDGFIKPFFEKPGFCKNDCLSCGYCDKYIKNCIDLEKTSEIFNLANEFYEKYDSYINMINDLKREKSRYGILQQPVNRLLDDDLNLDFSFEDDDMRGDIK
ncbi:MAG: U32 family peptidase [Caulobacteraceae bacterium]